VSETNWVPALVVLGVAVVGGALLALRARADAAPLPGDGATRASELQREKTQLYTLLREHHDARTTAPDPAAWRAALDVLEADAARVLRALDEVAGAGDASPAPPPTPRRGAGRGLAWGLGAAIVLGGLGWWVQQSATPRGEGMSVTGGQASEVDRALAALEAAVQANPGDIAARNRLGHAYLSLERPMDAFEQAKAVVALQTDDPEARTHQAVVLLQMGDTDKAGQVLDKVLAGAPTFAEALGWRGAIHYQLGQYPDAVTRWEAAVAADASLTPTLAPLLEAARNPSTLPPRDAAPPAPAAADSAPDPADITGRITATGSVPTGAVLFLFARPEGVESGPPTWVQRLPTASFPQDFRIGPANAMLGGPTPAALVLTARVDGDGNPSTSGPGDLVAKSAPLAPGATGVELALAPASGP
jgi:hypothetical protein